MAVADCAPGPAVRSTGLIAAGGRRRAGGCGLADRSGAVPSAGHVRTDKAVTSCGTTKTAANVPVRIHVQRGSVKCKTAMTVEPRLRQRHRAGRNPVTAAAARSKIDGWDLPGLATPDVLRTGNAPSASREPPRSWPSCPRPPDRRAARNAARRPGGGRLPDTGGSHRFRRFRGVIVPARMPAVPPLCKLPWRGPPGSASEQRKARPRVLPQPSGSAAKTAPVRLAASRPPRRGRRWPPRRSASGLARRTAACKPVTCCLPCLFPGVDVEEADRLGSTPVPGATAPGTAESLPERPRGQRGHEPTFGGGHRRRHDQRHVLGGDG